MTKMRRSLGVATLMLMLWPAFAAAPAPEMGPRQRRAAVDDPAAARVIVKYRSGSTLMQALAAGSSSSSTQPRHAAALGARLGLAMLDGRVLGERTQALRAQGITSAALAQRLAAQADVEWAVVDQRRTITAATPNDPYYGPGQTSITPVVGQWYLRAPDSTVKASINAIGAWATTTGSSAVTVAVLDTGVRPEHPDLAGKFHPGRDFVSSTDDTPGDTDSDATDPGDWTTASSSCGASSSSWHGTQVSGLIAAASDNNIGIAGTGRDVMLLPVRVLGKCGGYDSDILAGMRWAGNIATDGTVNPHKAQVINMSLGSTGSCTAAYTETIAALNAAGVTVVVAAGNENGIAIGTPANCPGAIAVTGLRHIGTKVGYSNVGPEAAIAAPAGNCVNTSGACLYPLLTTVNLGTTTPSSNGYSDSFNYSVGTSFSAPLVAGTVALMLSVNNTLTPAAIRSALQSTARAFPTTGADAGVPACHAPSAAEQIECYCTTSTCGAGMLDAAAAVAAVTPGAVPAPSAVINASSSTPTAGETVTLGSSGSGAFGGRSIASYQWQIDSGGTLAAFSGTTTGSSATLVTSAAGSVTVQLTVTDSAGATGSQSLTLTVQAAPAVQSSGGGGGASSVLWLALLGLASFSLRRVGSAQNRR